MRFAMRKHGASEDELTLRHIDLESIAAFLEYLEVERGASLSTRNHRVATFRAFFRYAEREVPAQSELCRRIFTLPLIPQHARRSNPVAPEDVRAIVEAPDRSTPAGRRDAALLAVLSDMRWRVEPVLRMRVSSVRLGIPAHLEITDERGRTRIVPLSEQTVLRLRAYLDDLSLPEGSPAFLFFNRQGEPLSRFGVRYVVRKYVAIAQRFRPTLLDRSIDLRALRVSLSR
jgi:site-specific recombinase XerD